MLYSRLLISRGCWESGVHGFFTTLAHFRVLMRRAPSWCCVLGARQAEGVTELTPKGFIDWCRNGSGYERKHLYDDKKLNEAVQV